MLKLKNDNTKILYKDFDVSYKNAIRLIKRSELKKGKKFSILSDSMFKTMFFTENRLKYSAKLISYFLAIDYDSLLNHLQLDKNELDKEKEYTKGEKCDYVARIDNTRINIEINNCKDLYTLERNIGYAFKLYLHNNHIGTVNEYKSVCQLNINNFSFKGLEDTYYINTLSNKKYRLTNDIIIIQIFVPNIINKCYTKGEESLTDLEKFIMTLVEQDITKAKKYVFEGDTVMNEYIEEAENVSFDNGFGESYDHEASYYDAGVGFGFEQGINQGIEQTKKETALAFLKKNIDIKTISECTGLSIEELESLKR